MLFTCWYKNCAFSFSNFPNSLSLKNVSHRRTPRVNRAENYKSTYNARISRGTNCQKCVWAANKKSGTHVRRERASNFHRQCERSILFDRRNFIDIGQSTASSQLGAFSFQFSPPLALSKMPSIAGRPAEFVIGQMNEQAIDPISSILRAPRKNLGKSRV